MTQSQVYSPTISPKQRKVNLCNVWIDRHSLSEAIATILDHAASNGAPAYVTPTNTQCLVMMQSDLKLRQIYNEAFLAVPDGVPLLWAAQLMRQPLNGRVNGTDLMEHLCREAAGMGLRIFFLGGRPQMAERAAVRLQMQYPGINIVGTCCPEMGFEKDAIALAEINDLIRSARPHLLFVGLGVPKQEYWIQKHHQAIDVPISVAVGGSFEMLAGQVNRAPKWMQRSGLEWLFRLLIEPQRLWKRYLVCNSAFVWLMIQQRLGWLHLEERTVRKR
jgi:N-acetylglucosaminyldiphosphoundecaprenol N-acetyl-beta-D-mannosaminyltransferase